MNTYVTATIYDPGTDVASANARIDSVFEEIRRVEGMATDYNDTSQIGRINASAGIDSIPVSDELVGLLREGLRYDSVSAGAFDISIGPIVKAWDFLSAHPHVPPQKQIDTLLPLVDEKLIAIRGNMVYLPRKAMAIDLGGIAKGYAVDRAVRVMLRGGYKRFIIDIGGNLGVHWDGTDMLDSTVAEILIRHPRRDGEYFGKFMMGTGGVSTSGDYQRFFIQDGVRYHHIIEPRTGMPARGVVSVTIVAPDATSADAMSTLVFVMGRDKGMEFIRKSPRTEGIIVYESGDTLAYDLSPGFKGKFHLTLSHD